MLNKVKYRKAVKKIVSLCIALSMYSVSTMAQVTPSQPEPTKEEKAAAKAKKEADQESMFTELQLTEEQKTKYKAIIKQAGNDAKLLKEKTGMTEEEKTAAKKTITDNKNKAINELLGDEKYKLYKAIGKRQKEATTTKE